MKILLTSPWHEDYETDLDEGLSYLIYFSLYHEFAYIRHAGTLRLLATS